MRIVLFDDSAYGTDETALAAEGAVRFFHGEMIRRCDDNLIAAVREGQSFDALHVFTGADTAAAFDTFRRIAHEAWVGINGRVLLVHVRQMRIKDIKPRAETLQIAVFVARAGEAAGVVIRHDELQDTDLRIADDLGVREYLHAFPDFGGTCREQLLFSCDLHRTKAAARFYPLIGMIAEMRNVDIDELRRFDDLCALRRFERDIVYFQMNRFH